MSEEQPPDSVPTRDGIVLLTILVEGGLVALALLVGWVLSQPPLQRFSFDAKALGWGLLATLPMLAMFAVMNRWPVGPLASIKRFTENVLRPILAQCTVVDLLGMSCLAGMGEEMFFRGFLQDGLQHWLPLWVALGVASVVFGLLHAITLTYAVLAALMGAYFGWLYEATGNLLAPMTAHALYDFVVLLIVVRGLERPEDEDEEEESEDDEE
jgi:membrane protease YdiL (CAAX protease family)